MAEMLPDDARILGTHPRFGPDSGRETIAGLPMVLCPVRIDREPLARWERFFAGLDESFLDLNWLRVWRCDDD